MADMSYLNIVTNVFEFWADALSETDIGEETYFERPSGDIKLPCASLLPLPSGELGHDLHNDASGIELTIQTDLFVRAETPLSKIYELNAVSHAALVALGFRLTASTTPEMPQNGYKRLISRYARVIGYGEPLAEESA